MRIAVVSPHPDEVFVDKPAWAVAGFQALGHDCIRCHTLKDVAAADAECDLLVFDHKGAGVCRNALADMARTKRARWVQWYRDLIALEVGLPLSQQPFMVGFRKLMQRMDLVFVKERDLLAEYAELGINAVWLDQGCPSDMPACEYRESPEFDVLVIGSTAYAQRSRDSRALVDAGYKVAWAGLSGAEYGCTSLGFLHPTKELPQAVSRAAVVLSVDYRSDVAGYTSDRTWLLSGMGAPLVCRVADVDKYLGIASLAELSPQVGVAAWHYSDTDRLLECVAQAIAKPQMRSWRGRQGRARTFGRHLYRHRCAELLQAVPA